MQRELVRVCVSGYFDPLHAGHIDYLRTARELGDVLIVIVNTDRQAQLQGRTLQNAQEERRKILESIRYVHQAIFSVDDDYTVSQTLRELRPAVFANGGSCVMFPELRTCEELGIQCVTRVGGSNSHLQRMGERPYEDV